MIDMVFLLLVFFMTVSTMAKDARPEVELPRSETARVPESAPPREIVTVLPAPEGFRIYWRDRPVELEELCRRLAGAKSGGDEAMVLLRGPADLPWEGWKPILDCCREAGIADIEFATFEA